MVQWSVSLRICTEKEIIWKYSDTVVKHWFYLVFLPQQPLVEPQQHSGMIPGS